MLGKLDVAAMIPVRDLPRARQWYFEKLGFEPVTEMPDGLNYRSGSSTFSLYQTQFSGTAKHTLMGWQADDLEREMRELRAKGIKFEEYDMPGLKTVNGVATMGNERAAWFKDLDGNILAVAEMTK
jgi:catechol 2,3-dioxygenase-like lactoylglutathione lyase family enzyme